MSINDPNKMEIIQENSLDNKINRKSRRIDILKNRLKMVKGDDDLEELQFSKNENRKNALREAIDNEEIKNKFDSLNEPFDEWIIKSMSQEFEINNLAVKKFFFFKFQPKFFYLTNSQ
jgi:hypothetical protein